MFEKDMRGDYVAWDTETTDKFPDDAPLEEAPYNSTRVRQIRQRC